MTLTFSPLRYPGGKSCLYPLLAVILDKNELRRTHYVEPYAGGCGLALSLLIKGDVSEIHINDIDISIWAFWHCVLEQTDELISKIRETPVTIEQWHIQREIHNKRNKQDLLSLGFATFFLNRTNISGIIKRAGPIGGRLQKGNYKLDCRYNTKALINKILIISQYKDRVHLTNLDAVKFIQSFKGQHPADLFFCIDPPYFKKGAELYTSSYAPKDHAKLANEVLKLKSPWIVTYDYIEDIKNLYGSHRQFCFDINYSLQTKKIANELLIVSKGLKLPENIESRQINQASYKAA